MLRILVSEAEPIIALDIQQILEGYGHVVMLANFEQDLLETCRQFQPNLILLNFKQVYHQDGMALAKALKDQLNINILLITGAPPKEVCESTAYHPGIPVLYKPFIRKQLRLSLEFIG